MLKNQQRVEYYETTALKNASVILQTAQQQFRNGDINYLEWVLLTNQAIAIQSEYSDAVKNLNQSIIEINSLTNQ
jgi:cobalt-zinc-cadmium resistance protein CzcA